MKARAPAAISAAAASAPSPGQPAFFSMQITGGQRFFSSGARGAGRARLVVVGGGWERVASDYRIQRRRFPYLGFEFVAAGRGTLNLRWRDWRLVPGTVFSYGQATPHDIRTDERDPLVKYFVDFDGSAARTLLKESGLPIGTVAQTSAMDEVVSIFDELVRSGRRDSRFSGRITVSLLQALLLKVAETRVPPGSVESAAFGTYQRCRQELEQHALQVRSLGELAERCRVDVAYLCRLFQRFGGESPYRRLLRMKMQHAASRLQQPGALVKQVAAELGFSDPYHFSRAFKSVFGVSPRHAMGEENEENAER